VIAASRVIDTVRSVLAVGCDQPFGEDWIEIPEDTLFGAADDITTVTRSLVGAPSATAGL
jgi:hypothetical protein